MTQILCYEELETMFSEALNCHVKFIPEILLDKEKSIMKYEAYVLETVHKPLSKTGIKNKMKELTELLQSCGIEAVINKPYYNDMHCIINRNDIENIKVLLKLKGRMIS